MSVPDVKPILRCTTDMSLRCAIGTEEAQEKPTNLKAMNAIQSQSMDRFSLPGLLGLAAGRLDIENQQENGRHQDK